MHSESDKFLYKYVITLAEKAQEESSIYPVDRAFLEKHLNEIVSFNPTTFIYYNFELANDIYVNQLFACLPEVWLSITLDDLILICKKFTNVFSYYSLIRFTYKYVEIDIINIVLNIAVQKQPEYYDAIIQYIKNQWNLLVKSEEDFKDFSDGFIDVDYSKWIYIKQKFLLDNRVKPARLNIFELEDYIKSIVDKKD